MSLNTQAVPKKKLHLPVSVIRAVAPILGAILGLALSALLVLIAGANPLVTYKAMFMGAFGGKTQITETLLKTGPLLMIGLGMTAAFRARVWNIGAEGQYYIGALLGSLVALFLPNLPRPLLIFLMLAAGILGGALWGLVPAIFKIKNGVNEIISTLMLNYIAILFVTYLTRGPLQEPGGYLPMSAQFSEAAQLPTLFGTRLHLGTILVALLVPVVYVLLWHTPLGFRLRAVGSRDSVARYAGFSVEKSILFALIFSGALAGLAGIIEVSTYHLRLKAVISTGYGFGGILVALLGRMNPLGVVVSSIFFSALLIGAESMHVLTGLPVTLADAIQALIVLCVMAVDALIRRRFE